MTRKKKLNITNNMQQHGSQVCSNISIMDNERKHVNFFFPYPCWLVGEKK
jgi:hypothetical protein